MLYIISLLLLIVVLVLLNLQTILAKKGLHPHLHKELFHVAGKKALIVTTSQGTLGEKGKATGVFSSEMTIPYYEFFDNGMQVDIASIKGGEIPIEKLSLRWPIASLADKRFKKDRTLQQKVKNSFSIEGIDFNQYDVIFFSGGWGAAYDMGQSLTLGKKVSSAYKKGILLASVCHGALGFIQGRDDQGEPIIKGKKISAVTNKQIKELGISKTPLHPETELKKRGAQFESQRAKKDMFATFVSVDGQFITGQNQNSGQEVAYEVMKILEKK